jgi:hypothetical protein
MHVITNDGTEYVILSDIYASSQVKNNTTAHIIMADINGNEWMNFDKYTCDLRCNDDDDNFEYEIQAVFEPRYYKATLMSVRDDEDNYYFTKLWERPTKKKMTKSEIEKELGYEIEIVDEDRNGFDF